MCGFREVDVLLTGAAARRAPSRAVPGRATHGILLTGAPGSLVGKREPDVRKVRPAVTPDRNSSRSPMRRYGVSGWRQEAVRTTLWVLPTVMVALAIALF